MFDFSNYLVKSKYYDDSSQVVASKMKDETAVEAITEFVGLKPKTYLFLVDDNNEHKKANGMNEKAVENKKIGTYEIKKFFCLALMIKYIP